jgi:hypothetical protein
MTPDAAKPAPVHPGNGPQVSTFGGVDDPSDKTTATKNQAKSLVRRSGAGAVFLLLEGGRDGSTVR